MIGNTDRTLILINESTPSPESDMETVLDRNGWGPEGPVEGVDITRPICRCKFSSNSQLGQGCSKPTAGGSGSAEYGVGADGHAGDSNVATVVLAAGAGVGLLFLLGVL